MPAEDEARIQEKVDQTMLSAFEYAQFAEFDEDAVQAAFDMHTPDRKSPETTELSELREKLRRNRAAFNISSDGEPSYLESKQIDPETGAELEEVAQDMLDEPMTSEEAAALHAQEGGKGKNPYEGGSYRGALKMRKHAADPTLRRMIALKRQAYGEELSAEDQEELRKLAEARKNAGPMDEGDYALKRTS